jgi:proteasome lid subunit RPN8/RPN11
MDLATAGMPREVCGFVTDDWDVIHMTNVSVNPHKGFAMDPEEMLDVLVSEARNATGIWHSHPSGRGYPSEEDKTFFLIYPAMRHFIVTVMNVWEWRLTDGGVRPVKRDGSTGAEGMACPLLTAPAEVRR